MKWKLVLGALVLSAGLCGQSFGAELLDRMLGLNCCGNEKLRRARMLRKDLLRGEHELLCGSPELLRETGGAVLLRRCPDVLRRRPVVRLREQLRLLEQLWLLPSPLRLVLRSASLRLRLREELRLRRFLVLRGCPELLCETGRPDLLCGRPELLRQAG